MSQQDNARFRARAARWGYCLAIRFVPAPFVAPARAAEGAGEHATLPRNYVLLRRAAHRLQRVECVEMLSAILQGSQMGPGDGWFHPSKTRYDRYWLAA